MELFFRKAIEWSAYMDKQELILHLLQNGVFTVGKYITNTQHSTNYYINTSNICTGSLLLEVGRYISETIQDAINKNILDSRIDVFASPAYKGISLSVSTCIALQLMDSLYDIKYCCVRKSDKKHGEGGNLVGTQLSPNKRVVIIDDVLSTGTTIRSLISSLKQAADIALVGILVLIDRCDYWENGLARELLSKEYGIPVLSVIDATEVEKVAALYDEFVPIAEEIKRNI